MTHSAKGLSEGNRFSALLNPIRDLAASWGIDVARELSEYAESLGITARDASETNDHVADEYPVAVDFAQAALLVQGSTSIYSRKVEHLYSLVYLAVSTLNQMGSKSKGTTDGGNAPAQNDAEADALLDIDEIDFLTLDDDIPQVDPKTITLKSEPQPSLFFRDETRLPPVPPMLAHTSAGNGRNATAFKIATARTHSSGALIMEGCPPLNEDLNTLPTTNGIDSEVHAMQAFEDDAAPEIDNDDGDGFVPAFPEDHGPEMTSAEIAPPSVTGSQAIIETAALYGFTSSRRTSKRLKPRRDPFLMLDPHEPCPTHDKPTKMGRTYKKPKKLRKKPANIYHTEASPETNLEDLILSKLPRNASVKNYVSFSALQSCYASICRKRRAQQRREALQGNRSVGPGNDSEEFGDIEAEDGVGGDAHFLESTPDFEEEEDEFEAPEQLHLPDAQFELLGNETGLDRLNDIEAGDQLGSNFAYLASSFEETCRKHLEKTAWMWEQRTTDINLVRRVEEWTTRILPLLEQEERRPEFDISRYGQAILNDLKELSEVKEVEKTRVSVLLQQPAKFEVCRKFLATLQLANNYTLEIIPPKGSTVEDFFIRIPSSGKENRAPVHEVGRSVTGEADKITEPGKNRAKRLRQPGSTPKSARRQPLRPRFQLQNSAE